MKVKIFDMVLDNVPAGKSPATHLEDQINGFLKTHATLHVIATRPTLAVAAGPGTPVPLVGCIGSSSKPCSV